MDNTSHHQNFNSGKTSIFCISRMAWSLPNSLHSFTFAGLSLRCSDLCDFVDPDDFFRAALTTTETRMALAAIISFTIFFVLEVIVR